MELDAMVATIKSLMADEQFREVLEALADMDAALKARDRALYLDKCKTLRSKGWLLMGRAPAP